MIIIIFCDKDIDFVTYFQETFVNFTIMSKKEIFAIGLMSGTSLDGIDLVYVKFLKNEYSFFEIIHAETVSYTTEWKQVLQQAIHLSSDALLDLDVVYGKHLGSVLADFISNYKITEIDFIASHGHTVLHQPEEGITLQIGSGVEIAKITQQKVVSDFRTQDVKLGGQGAPLAVSYTHLTLPTICSV